MRTSWNLTNPDVSFSRFNTISVTSRTVSRPSEKNRRRQPKRVNAIGDSVGLERDSEIGRSQNLELLERRHDFRSALDTPVGNESELNFFAVGGPTALVEEPLGGAPNPRMAVSQRGRELPRVRLGESRQRFRLVLVRHDAPDAPAVAAFQVQLLLDVVRQRQRRLDHFAVEVEDVERPVRADRQVTRAEPVVGRGEELARRRRCACALKIGPFGSSRSRWIRLFAGSQTKTLPRYFSGNSGRQCR